MEHLFVNCEVSVKLYLDIRKWLNRYNIVLPDLTLTVIVVGLCSSENLPLIDFLLLLFKVYIYKNRDNPNVIGIEGYKAV